MSQAASLPSRVRGVYYGWWLVPITGLVRVLTSASLFHAMTIWFVALESHFGWSRTQLSRAFAFTRIEGGVMGPVEGYLTDRLETRRMVLIGLLVLGVGFLLFWQVRSLWMFYLAFVVMSLGYSLAGWAPVTAVLNNWFARRRATAMGWSKTVSRLGGLLLVPAIAWAIDPDQEGLGWQLTALMLGIFTLAIALSLSRLIRNRPEEHNRLPHGRQPAGSPSIAVSREGLTTLKGNTSPADMDLTTAQALRTPAFWFISLGLFMKDQGFDVQTTAWLVSVYSAVSMVFQLVGGYMGDRVPARLAIFLFTTIQAGSVVLLTFAATIPVVYLFAILFALGLGDATR